jgi:predicted DNA-binding antitoxin AbrB/MazE fold protein
MTTATKVRARYSKGTLKLLQPLHLPEGAEVQVSVTATSRLRKDRRPGKRRYHYPTRTLPWRNLRRLSGVVALGGDALADSEALYV